MEGCQVEDDTGQRLPNRRCETLMMSFGSAFVPRLLSLSLSLRFVSLQSLYWTLSCSGFRFLTHVFLTACSSSFDRAITRLGPWILQEAKQEFLAV
jgi:hypothetical protein